MIAAPSYAVHFPDKPYVWLARGFYRAPHMKGHTCSVSVYTSNRGAATAHAAADRENPWMRITALTFCGVTKGE